LSIRDHDQQLLVGKITGAYGIKGWVKVHSFTSPLENIVSYLPWDLHRKGAKSEHWQLGIAEAKVHGKGLVVRFEDFTDRNQAEEITGAEIYVDRDALEELPDDEYYWSDLFGLEVINSDGSVLGKVDSMMETGANDVLVVEGKERHLLPYVPGDVIKSVDIEEGIIRVDWVEPE